MLSALGENGSDAEGLVWTVLEKKGRRGGGSI